MNRADFRRFWLVWRADVMAALFLLAFMCAAFSAASKWAEVLRG